MAEVTRLALETPGVARTMEVSGYNNMDKLKQQYAGFAMVVLDPFEERTTADLQVGPILKRLRTKLATIADGRVMVRNAPAVPGLGATGGFAFQIQDISGQGIDALGAVAKNFITAARQRPELAGIFTTYNGEVPKRFINVDRTKVKTNQVSITELFDSLQIYLGSLYVNEFNKFGRVYRVYVQAEEDARDETSDIGRLRIRNKNGEMIPVDTLVNIESVVGPYNIPHYNSYRSIAIAGRPSYGYSSGDAIATMEELAETVLPDGFAFEWTGVIYQQLKAGNLTPLAFGLAFVFAFLVLAALYESWALPFVILLSTPLGLLGAAGFLHLRGMELDVYGQIALVMLIGLVAKNAILVVEFAKTLRDQGASIIEAATTAARLRLRPVLMTSLSFIIGLLPLVMATGPGSVSRQSIGTAVVGGLAFATITIMFVPVFFVIIERIREGMGDSGKDETGSVDASADSAVS
jgi:HAE1 family hydrophobic/amphiphilic exporter-1